jgi:hypothetical protein
MRIQNTAVCDYNRVNYLGICLAFTRAEFIYSFTVY